MDEHHRSNQEPSDDSATDDHPDRGKNLLLEYLATSNDKCPLCRYQLRGLTEPRCPECGRPLPLSVGIPESIHAAWITATIGASFGTPPGIIGLVAFAQLLLRGGRLPDDIEFWFISIVSVSIACWLAVLLVFRRRFQILSSERQ